jgi:hypothetical protein
VFLASRSRNSLRRLNRFSSVYAVVSAALQAIGDIVLQPVLILSAAAFLLGGGNFQIASFAVIAVATWALAPFLLQVITSFSSRPYPIVFTAGVIRIGAILVLGVVGFRIDDISTTRLVSTLIWSYLVYQVASAVAVQASASLVVGGVPRSRQEITFRRESFVAVVAAVVSAFAVWSVFRTDETFQESIGLVLMLAALATFSATWFLLSIPGVGASLARPGSDQLLVAIATAFRSTPFRRFISFKIFLALAAAVDPFLIVFGFQQLGLEVEYIGLALVAFAGGQAAGYLIWPKWVARHSPRVPFQVAALMRLVLLTWVIALPTLSTSNAYTERFDSPDVAMRGFALGFVLLGLATSVGNTANQRYLIDIAPRGATQGSILAANAIAALTAFAAFGVAWLLASHELERILWGAAGVMIVALLASGLLVESRVRVRSSPGSWRSRRQTARTV